MNENRDESRERPSGSSSDSSTAASSAEIGRCGSDGGDGCSGGGGVASTTTILLPWSPLEGEELVNQESVFSEVIYHPFPNERIKGNLFITNFRFYFNSDINENVSVLDMPLGIINRVDKLYNNPNQMNEVTGILIYCKNGQKINIQKNENDANFEKFVYIHLVRYAFPLSHGLNFFAFSYRPKLPNNNGWNVYDPEKEYKRMGVEESSNWYISKMNNEYKLCDSYPRCLAVPQFVENTNLLEKIAQFRSRGRFPVLSWLSPAPAHVPILRSAQPQCGMFNRRSTEDESYLRFIAERCSSSNSSTTTTGATSSSGGLGVKHLYIYDARPFKNALANYTSGGGYENEKYYTWCKLVFLNIENIHAMRDSLGATNSEQFHVTTLENSKWLEHIRLILEGALTVVDKIESGHPVLVHCSDGWDRTAQLTSLSMLLLDKYYRTIEGFEVLIEKEWVSFGHKFGTRMGHGSDRHSDSDRSPIFIQFIDCVWQVMQDQPRVFEFNEKLLLTILEHIYTCQFGTFLMDSDYDREKYDLKSKTISLWSYVNNNLNEYVNEEYFEYDRPLRVSKERCRLWTAYYFQHRRDDLNATCNSTNNNEHVASSINNGDLNASALDRTNPNNDSRNLEPFGTLLDNLFSNSYRLFSKILEKN